LKETESSGLLLQCLSLHVDRDLNQAMDP
jgi:hypothetical protein